MKTKIKYFIILLWMILIALLKIYNLIPNIDLLKGYLLNQALFAIVVFILLWIIRLMAFIPGITLMLLGVMVFGPIFGFLLSFLGVLLSETVVFVIANQFLNKKINQYFDKKYPDIRKVLEKYNYKLLALGIICPIAPSDAVCFLSASSGIKYSTYIYTVAAANIPFMVLYSSVGTNFEKSPIGILLILITLTLSTILTMKIWKKFKENTSVSN